MLTHNHRLSIVLSVSSHLQPRTTSTPGATWGLVMHRGMRILTQCTVVHWCICAHTLKQHTITLNLSESICHTLHKKTNPKDGGMLKCLSKVDSKRSHQEEGVQSAKSTTCVAPCSASQVLQVNNKFPSFPSMSEFCQVERYTFKPRCRLDFFFFFIYIL